MASYSRANPSPRYRELTELYRRLHAEGESFLQIAPADTFAGQSLPPQAKRVRRLIEATGATNLLDYGSGKGRQYDPCEFRGDDGRLYDGIQDYWGVDFVECYDPAYAPYSRLPDRRFDGVVCTDVLEHCPEEDLPWIVDEMFGFAERFVFASVACFPAIKRLPNGENVHCTVRPPDWWRELFDATGRRYPGVEWEVWAQVVEDGPEGQHPVDHRLARTGG